MSGDYTRFTFNPVKGYSGVLKQQGRVSLDADANELEAILDRRDRAEMYDTVGQAVYPITTPDAFEIGVSGSQLTIGPGRLYVDGILAECFGDLTKLELDERLNDLAGTLPVLYDAQPFHYSPSFPALAAGVNVVYLDVWQREVTVFEDYALRDVALNGPDTATRVQTAWQVKAMAAPNATSCSDPVAAWEELIAPSSARLTATTTPSPPAAGPCVISPAGGYTGLENRLYRVEVHQAGTLGGATSATFKWSRDNASRVARVLAVGVISAADWLITVGSTGRDSWTRLAFGDRVELLDDDIELAMRETGRGGVMAKVVSVNHATGEIHVEPEAGASFTFSASRHPRLRQWDYAAPAEPFVRDCANGVAVALEHGISVTFGTNPGDTLHAGDFWVFSARTADGTIDTVVAQPPRNVLHHYAKLALVAGGSPPQVLTDCRIPWPSLHEGCCSQVVAVGENIQAAIDKLDGIGGCVCLKMGVHHIGAPLRIKQSNVTIHGEVPWVTVRMEREQAMLRIAPVASPELENVSVEGILFEAVSDVNNEPLARVERVVGGRIDRCGFRILKPSTKGHAIGIDLVGCHDYTVSSVRMKDLPNGVRGAECEGVGVLDSTFIGPSARNHTIGEVSLGEMGIQFGGLRLGPVVGTFVERNILSNYSRAVQLGDIGASGSTSGVLDVTRTAAACRVVANTVLRNPDPPAHGTPPIAFAIAAHVARCEIGENSIDIATLQQYGILVAGGNTLVYRNELRSKLTFENDQAIPIGVLAVEAQDDALICAVRENLFLGLQRAVVATGGGSGLAHRVDVIANRIRGDAKLVDFAMGFPNVLPLIAKYGAITLSLLSDGRVADNEIEAAVCGVAVFAGRGISVVSNRMRTSNAAVMLLRTNACEVADNLIEPQLKTNTLGVGLFAVQRSSCSRNVINGCDVGIRSLGCSSVRLQDNRIQGGVFGVEATLVLDLELRGNDVEGASRMGIVVLYSLHELTLSHNHALRCGYRGGAAANAPAAVGIAVLLSLALVTVENCRVIDTGEAASPGLAQFVGARHGIAVLLALGARVRGCEIVSRPTEGFNPQSRALRMWALPTTMVPPNPGGPRVVPFAYATDNVIEQSTARLVEMITNSDLMFASNRCNDPARAQHVVLLAGESVTVTGNRVRLLVPQNEPLAILFSKALSAVGNVVTAPGAIVVATAAGAAQLPAPYSSFNANS